MEAGGAGPQAPSGATPLPLPLPLRGPSAPAPSPQLGALYKTQLCRHFMRRGACSYADRWGAQCLARGPRAVPT